MQAEYAAAFDTQAGTYEEMRAAYREERKMWNSGGPEMAETIDFEIPFGEDKVPARLLRPVKAEKLPVIFFMHGGGFVLGDNDTHNLVQRKLAAYSGCVVVGIEYTLSPEVVYPRAIEECTTACKYVLEHAEEYGIDPEKIWIRRRFRRSKPFYGRLQCTYVMMDLISLESKVTFYSTDLMV